MKNINYRKSIKYISLYFIFGLAGFVPLKNILIEDNIILTFNLVNSPGLFIKSLFILLLLFAFNSLVVLFLIDVVKYITGLMRSIVLFSGKQMRNKEDLKCGKF